MRLTPEIEALLRQVQVSDSRIERIIQTAVDQGRIRVPTITRQPAYYAGGTNMCPNSDFAFSHLAATVPGTSPTDAAADNQKVYRVFRQLYEANISATNVNATEATAEAPQWDKVQGTIALGSDDSANNYDIAIQFTNNWLVGNRRWYVRVAVALTDDTPLPSNCKLFAGFWVKRSGPSEDWASGDGFTLSHEIQGVPGTRNYKYKCIAKTDTGFTVESAELDVTNVPTTLGPLPTDNKVLITYPGGVGFIEFKLYRKNVTTGQVDLIAWDRNTTNLRAFDTDQSIMVIPDGFPTVPPAEYRAYEEIPIDAVPITQQKTFHDFVIRIPASLDNSNLIAEGTYLRIGVLGETAINRQVIIDTVWASESYNVWSPSPFDNYQSPPSTTMTTAPPTGGGNPGEPPIGGGPTCLWIKHDLLLTDGKEAFFVPLDKCEKFDVVDNSTDEPNTIDHFLDADVSQHFIVSFDCGLVILCSNTHRFLRTPKDRSGVIVSSLKKGMTLSGGRLVDGKIERSLLTVTGTSLINKSLKVRMPKMALGSKNKRFSVGDRSTGWFVDNSNLKPIEQQF